MSAADEDTELRDLLVQTLDKNGVLGKIKAELRASIFLALEAQEQNKTPNPLKNTNLQKFVLNDDGKACIGIINQFLEYFHLDYTSAVFEPETNISKDLIPDENKVRDVLHLGPSVDREPLLAQMVNNLKEKKSSTPQGLDNHQIQFLRTKFDTFDPDHSGLISQKDVTSVVSLACPLFHPSILEKFVAEEFRNKYSSNVTFDGFMSVFQKLYEMCSSITMVGNQIRPNSLPTRVKSPEKRSSSEEFYMKQPSFHQVPTSPIPMSDPEPARTSGADHDSGGLPSAYLMPTNMAPHDGSNSMDVRYDNDLDLQSRKRDPIDLNIDGTRGRGDLPEGYTDTPAMSPESSRTSDVWPNKKQKTDEPSSHQQYEDDFNSEQSISEDIQDMGDDLLQSSEKDESLDLTEDRTVSEIPHADYMEDIRHG
uniref:centrosomal protein 43-like n=1 Tax=Styela clava TaxID=7725 RepID=UPI001939C3CB|nr:centrosomal protein 43-like [Styela clava]